MDGAGWGQAFIVIINATYSDVKTSGEFIDILNWKRKTIFGNIK